MSHFDAVFDLNDFQGSVSNISSCLYKFKADDPLRRRVLQSPILHVFRDKGHNGAVRTPLDR